MRFKIAAVGRLKELHFMQAIAVYEKRMRSYARLEVVEVKEAVGREPLSEAARRHVLAVEGERLLAMRPPRSRTVALDPRGVLLTSEQFARQISEQSVHGMSEWTFWIGGAYGLADRVREAADTVLSLSPMTLTHGLARVVLAEQLYRAMTILRGEPYHK